MEAIDLLYDYYSFDFRSFEALNAYSDPLFPRRWNTLRKVHLRYHFGYHLWTVDPPVHGPKFDQNWHNMWEILSQSQGLQELLVDLHAYLEAFFMPPVTEAKVFKPLMAMKVASKFRVKVSWLGHPDSSAALDAPFHLERRAESETLFLQHYKVYLSVQQARKY